MGFYELPALKNSTITQYSEIEIPDKFVVYVDCNYVIFIWTHDEADIYEVLEDQLNTLKELTSWNPRVNVIVVVEDVYLSSQHTGSHGVLGKTTPTHLYTYFPYQDELCGEVKDVVLIDTCVDDSLLHRNVDLFPEKIPTNFKGCTIKVGTIGFDPFVSVVENYTLEDHTRVYKVGGMLVDKVVIPIQKLNAEINFLPPTRDTNTKGYLKELADVSEGYSDILIGLVPLAPALLFSALEPTIPYEFTEMKWVVPCPPQAPRLQKIMSVFSLPVWVLIISVIILTALVFSCSNHASKYSSEPCNKLTPFRSFYDVWAIFMNVSVPKMPKTTNRRILFFIYVCYSFAMSIIFQAYFVTYLVEPGYEKNLETFDELLRSNLKYGYVDIMELTASTTDYTEHKLFPQSRRVDCSDVTNCMKRVILKRDIAAIGAPIVSHYIASILGVDDEMKVVCFLEERLVFASNIALLPKGSPLLPHLNVLIRRTCEGGLVDKLWEETKHIALLTSEKRSTENGNDLYFVFSLSHLSPVFILLIVGLVICSFVFLLENTWKWLCC
ncbi:hypothetical protein ANN_19786 [Periplaneta americana]|uniref:Ionotropic glutamate receptor C-terminal domain-containing protein n=1 Tax=Periplaneta americana TaxID=6978 RepID=A0ABQ8SAT9_PERAM|nr:hypothetical protein ANN_19786 [Periplaneta americana]